MDLMKDQVPKKHLMEWNSIQSLARVYAESGTGAASSDFHVLCAELSRQSHSSAIEQLQHKVNRLVTGMSLTQVIILLD
jgi:hypothetical protein